MTDQKESTSLEGQDLFPIYSKDDEGTGQKPSEGADKSEVKGEGEEVKTPAERVYKQVEWDKRQSTIDKQINELREQITGLAKERDDFKTQSEEQKLADWLRAVEADGGDVTQAKAVADAQRAVSKRARELEATQQQITGRLALIELAEKREKARGLVKTHSLDEESLEELLKAETPQDMEVRALTMRVEKLSAEKTPATKVASGAGSTQGVDESKLSLTERAGRAIDEAFKK